jgi:hypothetical protein
MMDSGRLPRGAHAGPNWGLPSALLATSGRVGSVAGRCDGAVVRGLRRRGFFMPLPHHISWLMILIVSGLIAWHYLADRRSIDPPDAETRRKRYKVAWEVRGLVLAVFGPYAAGMLLGYVSTDYVVPLMLFLVAGMLSAESIAPHGLRIHR